MNHWNRPQRSAFLAAGRIGVLTVGTTEPVPATPIWYRYEPEIGVTVLTSLTSRKGRVLTAEGRFGLTVVDPTGYRYVTVEGPVIETRPCTEADLRRMAEEQLGAAAGERYTQGWIDSDPEDGVFVMRPERWFGADLVGEVEALAG